MGRAQHAEIARDLAEQIASTLEVIDADERRIDRLRLHPPRPVPEGAEG